MQPTRPILCALFVMHAACGGEQPTVVTVTVAKGACPCAPVEYDLMVLRRMAGGFFPCAEAAVTTKPALAPALRTGPLDPEATVDVVALGHCKNGDCVDCYGVRIVRVADLDKPLELLLVPTATCVAPAPYYAETAPCSAPAGASP